MVSTNAAGGHLAYGKALQGSSNGAGTPTLSHGGFGEATTATNFLLASSAKVIVTATSGTPTLQDIGGLDLDWGRWNQTQLDVVSTTLSTTDAKPANDTLWAVFKPANMSSLTGTHRYGNNSSVPINGSDHSDGNLNGGVIEFDIDFGASTDAISNGSLTVYDSNNDTWRATFNGDINHRTVGDITGTFATMTDISGTYKGTQPITDGAFGGAFTNTTSAPAFVGGFSLKANDSGGGAVFVQGMTVLNSSNCFTCPL
jgi:hypothetical protein